LARLAWLVLWWGVVGVLPEHGTLRLERWWHDADEILLVVVTLDEGLNDRELHVTDEPAWERFVITADGQPAGFVQYQLEAGLIVFTHTEIDPRFEGRGLASALIRHVLDEARARRIGVLPLCPFVRAYIARHGDYLDLVPAGRRGAFGLPVAPDAV
jgi:predicted GNAT family acetyltransferase